MSQAPEQNGYTSEPKANPPQDFIPDEIPEQLKDDALVQYLRCRYEARGTFFPEQEKGKDQDAAVTLNRERVHRELARIELIRETYQTTPENMPVVHEFKRLRAAWKIHAKANSREALESVSTRVSAMTKIKPKSREERVLWERDILLKVQKWRLEEYQPCSATSVEGVEKSSKVDSKGCFSGLSQAFGKSAKKKKKPQAKKSEHVKLDESSFKKPERPQPPDSYGISVSKITLKKSSTSSSYMNDGIERYDLHEVLYDKENSPVH